MQTVKRSMFKFAVVSLMMGVFSPGIHTVPEHAAAEGGVYYDFSLFAQAEARRFHGGSVHRGAMRARAPRNINRNVNRNINRNVNRNVNINRNVHVHRGYYGGGVHYHSAFYRGGGYYVGTTWHPVANFTFGMLTGLAIGSIISSASMSSSCTTVHANGISYKRCGSTYYEPFYEGDHLQYRVVPRP